jgi:RNA polymerase sigma-70 factor, ECF subfamily
MDLDERIVLRIQNKDPEVFEKILSMYGDRLYRSAFCLTYTASDAEDLVQETFLQAFNTGQRFKGKSKVYTWLYGILFNLFREKLRKDKKKLINFAEIEEIASKSDAIEGATKIEVINEAVEELDEEYAIIIKLRYFENMSVEAISKKLKMKKGTVKSRLHYAKEKIRQKENVFKLMRL